MYRECGGFFYKNEIKVKENSLGRGGPTIDKSNSNARIQHKCKWYSADEWDKYLLDNKCCYFIKERIK